MDEQNEPTDAEVEIMASLTGEAVDKAKRIIVETADKAEDSRVSIGIMIIAASTIMADTLRACRLSPEAKLACQAALATFKEAVEPELLAAIEAANGK